MKRAALHNLGCKVNAYETEAMRQSLKEAGYEIVPFEEEADVYVINTCTVTNIADRKSRQMLHRAKKRNPQSIVVAVGCYAQAAFEDCEADKAIDLIIGNNRKNELVRMIEEYRASQSLKEVAVISTKKVENAETGANPSLKEVAVISQETAYEEMRLTDLENHTRAIVKVQDGCNQFCTYCLIPYVRGRVRSREAEAVYREAAGLAKQGYKEIVLTGIHLSSYGIDFKEEKKENLLSLIWWLHSIEGIERIRLGSLEPRIITEEFVKTLSSLKKVCPHFHLSLQSGCDSVLHRMNRHYSTEEYLQKCELLRKYFNNPAITTDVIVGFPGETEEEFLATQKFLEKVRFFEMHIFKYSKRTGTKAASMQDQVSEQEKAKRSNQLLVLERNMSFAYREYWIHQKVEVLIEENILLDGVFYWMGHTREYVKVVVQREKKESGDWKTEEMESQRAETEEGDLSGQIVPVIIFSSISDDILIGRII